MRYLLLTVIFIGSLGCDEYLNPEKVARCVEACELRQAKYSYRVDDNKCMCTMVIAPVPGPVSKP
jgi:hypothetical protein